MQQECNKNGEPRQPIDAVETLETKVALARHAVERYGVSAPRVTLPLAIAEVVLACAKAGMHKGQGRRRPPKSRGDKLRVAAIVAYARRYAGRRKRELMAIDLDQGKKPNLLDITNQAAVEASTEAAAFAAERYGLSLAASTIRRLMQAKPGRLAGVSDVD